MLYSKRLIPIHILVKHAFSKQNVQENSPGEISGMSADKDYILGSIDGEFPSKQKFSMIDMSAFNDYITNNIGKSIILFVYNSDTDQIRKVNLINYSV